MLALLCQPGFASDEPATTTRIAQIEQRLKERPEDFIAFGMLGQLHLRRSRETGDLGEYARAESAFHAALDIFPEFPGGLGGLASVRLALHRFAEAAELARQILRRDPSGVDGLLLLSDAELGLGDEAAAAKIIAQMADQPAVFARRAELARLHGANKEAVQLFLRAVDEARARGDSAENIAWYRVRAGEMFFRLGNFEDAGAQYEAALTLWPECYLAAEHRAEWLGAQGKFDEAAALYEQLIAHTPRPDLQQALGDLHTFRQQPERARPLYDRALAGYLASVARGEVHFIHHLAGFYADARENGPEAVKWARKDLALRHGSAAHESLAWALYRTGDFPASRAEMEQALAGGIEDAHFFYHAGLIYSAASEVERGQKYLRQTATVNPRYQSFHIHR